eukprot:m.635471 g.635471  ORF g.635471 m.635471 type:complete len:55 (+) comp22584_c0_seq1:2237-2401(+)
MQSFVLRKDQMGHVDFMSGDMWGELSLELVFVLLCQTIIHNNREVSVNTNAKIG